MISWSLFCNGHDRIDIIAMNTVNEYAQVDFVGHCETPNQSVSLPMYT